MVSKIFTAALVLMIEPASDHIPILATEGLATACVRMKQKSDDSNQPLPNWMKDYMQLVYNDEIEMVNKYASDYFKQDSLSLKQMDKFLEEAKAKKSWTDETTQTQVSINRDSLNKVLKRQDEFIRTTIFEPYLKAYESSRVKLILKLSEDLEDESHPVISVGWATSWSSLLQKKAPKFSLKEIENVLKSYGFETTTVFNKMSKNDFQTKLSDILFNKLETQYVGSIKGFLGVLGDASKDPTDMLDKYGRHMLKEFSIYNALVQPHLLANLNKRVEEFTQIVEEKANTLYAGLCVGQEEEDCEMLIEKLTNKRIAAVIQYRMVYDALDQTLQDISFEGGSEPIDSQMMAAAHRQNELLRSTTSAVYELKDF